jgi:hypothetical protein
MEIHVRGSMMATIPLEVQISPEELLRAVEHLPPQDLAAFVRQVLLLKAQRDAPSLSPAESTLLLQINQTLTPEQQQRYDELIARRQDETITTDELDELQRMTEEIEQRDAQRLAALVDLAQLRQTGVAEVMTALGITTPNHA